MSLLDRCRFCLTPLKYSFCDLGMSPLSNAFVSEEQLSAAELYLPLQAFVCHECFLVQISQYETPQKIFSNYGYFSSYSDTWIAHAQQFVRDVSSRFGIGPESQVIEIASNDGYLLRFFRDLGVPVLGIEPASNVAQAAQAIGIPTLVRFFDRSAAEDLLSQGIRANLLIGNNVLAHIPGLNEFVQGMKLCLTERGVISMEFPHLYQLIQRREFDTIYHEHFSYFSLGTVDRIFKHHGLKIFDAEELPTHGGSLRIFACHSEDKAREETGSVQSIIAAETDHGLRELDTYRRFNEVVQRVKWQLLEFLITAKNQGKRIVGYGAPAKSTTLLNYCGIGPDFLEYTVDRNPFKQGMYLPGTHIPVRHPRLIRETKPDYLLILAWNLKSEVMRQMECIQEWGGQFVIPVPEVEVIP